MGASLHMGCDSNWCCFWSNPTSLWTLTPKSRGCRRADIPAISPKWIRQIGIRSVDEGEKRFVHQMDLEVFDMRYIDEMCMEMIAETGRLTSLDVMELNPAMDERNRTALVAVNLIESLFGKSTLMRK